MLWLWRLSARCEASLSAAGLLVAVAVYPFAGAASGVGIEAMPVQLMTFVPALLLARLGVTRSLWFIALGWLCHGPWDLLVPHVEFLARMPDWYPVACLGLTSWWPGISRSGRADSGRSAGLQPRSRPSIADRSPAVREGARAMAG